MSGNDDEAAPVGAPLASWSHVGAELRHQGSCPSLRTVSTGTLKYSKESTQSRLRVAASPVIISTISLRPTESRLQADKLTQLPSINYALLSNI